jgi:RNA polymerase sigma-70 factor, ECF subfamily
MTSTGSPGIDEADVARRYLPVARIFFVRHGRGPDADDLAHEAILVSLQALRREQVRDPARLGGFVLGVCRNLVRAQARRDARREMALHRLEAQSAGAAPDAHAARVDGNKLWQCVNALSARARDVVIRSYVRDEEAGAIAAAHGTTAGNVRVLRHRALQALFRCLEQGERP